MLIMEKSSMSVQALTQVVQHPGSGSVLRREAKPFPPGSCRGHTLIVQA